MGVVECVKHDLFIEYPVLFEKEGNFVAQYKFTAMLLPSGKTARLTFPSAPPDATSECAIKDEQLLELLATSTDDKKRAKKKKKKGGGGGGDGDDKDE